MHLAWLHCRITPINESFSETETSSKGWGYLGSLYSNLNYQSFLWRTHIPSTGFWNHLKNTYYVYAACILCAVVCKHRHLHAMCGWRWPRTMFESWLFPLWIPGTELRLKLWPTGPCWPLTHCSDEDISQPSCSHRPQSLLWPEGLTLVPRHLQQLVLISH